MIEELKIADNPADIGYYSGIIVSAKVCLYIFAALIFVQNGLIGGIQLFTMYQWGRLSGKLSQCLMPLRMLIYCFK